MDYTRLSKEISYVLRHNPNKYNLSMDLEGYVLINNLLKGLNSNPKFQEEVTKSMLENMIKHLDKERFYIKDDKIKALYGHTIMLKIKQEEVIPPNILYHGTTESAYLKIKEMGLNKMHRQYVHLAKEKSVALSVGARRTKNVVLLEIAAHTAYLEGIKFYTGGDDIYLADYIPPKYITKL